MQEAKPNHLLSERDRLIVQYWATLPDPEKPHRPIRAVMLAREFNLSDRHIRRILSTVRKHYPSVYERVHLLRKFHVHKSRVPLRSKQNVRLWTLPLSSII
jgi:hypothetical protein